MDSDQNLDQHLERIPNLEQARRASVMAHSVVIKLKEMGLPDDLDGDLSRLCTDLGDLWSAQNALSRQMEAFLESPDNWEAVGDNLVDLRATIDHMAWHMKEIHGPVDRIATYAYGRSEG